MAFIMLRYHQQWDTWRDLPDDETHTDKKIYITQEGEKKRLCKWRFKTEAERTEAR